MTARPVGHGFVAPDPQTGVITRSRQRLGIAAAPEDRRWRHPVAVFLVLVALAARLGLEAALPPYGFPFLTFFPAVVLATLYGGLVPGLVSVVLSTASAKYFFIPYVGSFLPASEQETIALVFFTGVELLEVAVIHAMHRALARERAEHARSTALAAALSEGEARLREALDAGEMGSSQLDVACGTVRRDARLLRLFGLPPAAAEDRGEAFAALIHPEDHHAQALAMRRALDGTSAEYRAEFRFRRGDTGEERWLASRGRLLRDTGGRPLRLVAISYDITERKRAEARQLLLMREVDHRAKNTLAVVQALVSLSNRQDAALFAEAVQGRVAAMARAHELLARDHWDGADLRELAAQEVEAYRGEGRLTLEGPCVRLAPQAVQPLAMLLHELATNAAKYGALSVPGADVLVSWQDVSAATPDLLVLRWIERGGPAVPGPPACQGFGSILLGSVAKDQLGGGIHCHWLPEGLVCEVTIAPDLFAAARAFVRPGDSARP